jgi:ferredoxin--NADP+ reductase
MEQPLGSAARPVRIAIIGAGPAGFYTAEALLKQKGLTCSIDFFNRLPTPFGLVREGVAPDHQSIKAVTRIYDKIADQPNVRYFGNVTYGQDLHHADLKQYYDQIVYAVGAQSDRRMGIPGEDLAGSMPATAFVGWYNAHPDYRDLNPNLAVERVIVVGNGNVAMDVARILATDPAELATTDIADHALEALRASQVREVVMLGRRGPAQAAFTNAEVKEFGELHGVDVIVDPADLELDETSAASLADNKIATKNVDILRGFAERTLAGVSRRIVMRFLVSPVEIRGTDGVEQVRIEKNVLVPDGNGGLKAKGTGVFETIDAGMILRSVGYKGVPLPDVPFNEKNATINNTGGRVVDAAGAPVGGEYCVGWIKRGPSGVIGTNKPDAVATVQAMVEDLPNLTGIDELQRDPALIEQLLNERKPEAIRYAGWRKLDAYEVARGAEQQRPRVKLTNISEMLEVIKQSE